MTTMLNAVQKRSFGLAALLALLTMAAGMLASPASATTSVRPEGHVYGYQGQPLRSVDVYLVKAGKYTYLDTTDSSGFYQTDRHLTVALGTVELQFFDDTKLHSAKTLTTTLTSAEVPDVKMAYGSSVSGTVTSPTGLPLRNVCVLFIKNPKSTTDPNWAESCTNLNGRYSALGLGPGKPNVYFDFDGYSKVRRTVTVSDPATALSGVDFKNVKVPPKVTMQPVFRNGGIATISIIVSGGTYGVFSAPGKVAVYDGSKVVQSGLVLKSGKVKTEVHHLKRGTHRIRVKYLGSKDLTPGWSSTAVVTYR